MKTAIKANYGVTSRVKLSDDQLFEFLDFLKQQSSQLHIGQTVFYQGIKARLVAFVNSVVALITEVEQPKKRAYEVAICHLSPVSG